MVRGVHFIKYIFQLAVRADDETLARGVGRAALGPRAVRERDFVLRVAKERKLQFARFREFCIFRGVVERNAENDNI